jgi:hypothetical protein
MKGLTILLFPVLFILQANCQSQKDAADWQIRWQGPPQSVPLALTKNEGSQRLLFFLQGSQLMQQQLTPRESAATTAVRKLPFIPSALLPLDKKEWVMAGKADGKLRCALIKNNRIKWQCTLPDSLDGVIHAIGIDPLGGFRIGGETTRGYLLASLDNRGALRWLRLQARNRLNESIPSGIFCLSAAGEGEFLAAGYADLFGFGEKNNFLLRLRADDGKTLDNFEFGREEEDDIALAAIRLSDGSYQVLAAKGQALVQYRLNGEGRVLFRPVTIQDSIRQAKAWVLSGKSPSFMVFSQCEAGGEWLFREAGIDSLPEKKPEPSSRRDTEVNPPSLRALVVGYNADQYRYAEKDAADLAQLLAEKNEAGKVRVQASLLTADRAGKAGIMEALNKLVTDFKRGLLPPDHLILISLTLPGHRNENGIFLCPFGWDTLQPRATGLTMATIDSCLGLLPNPKLLLLDASFSGEVQTSLENTLFISSCGSLETNCESADWENGAFMLALKKALNGLADSDGDSRLSTAELAAYLLNSVPELARSKGFSQHPGVVKRTKEKILLWY